MTCASCRVRASASHRPRPDRSRQRQYHPIATRHPSAPAPATTPATGHVRADCASADQTAAAITAATAMEKHLKNADSSRRSAPRSPAPLPTNSPPLAPQTDTTSAVYSAGHKTEGGGADSTIQRPKTDSCLYYYILDGYASSAKGVGCDKRRPGSNPGFSALSVFYKKTDFFCCYCRYLLDVV